MDAEDKQEIEQLARREFAKQMAKGAGAIAMAAAMPAVFLSRNAFAQDVELPPGFANCRDPALKTLYILFHQNRWIQEYNAKSSEAATWGMNFVNFNRPRGIFVNVKKDTPFKEPAYYFLAEEMNMGDHIISYKEVEKTNKPITYFAGGIMRYFQTYVRNEGNYSESIESNFLGSIFLASGRSEKDVKAYLAMSLEQKRPYLKGCMARLKKRSYEDKLCAAWSAFFLTDNYYIQGKKNKRTMLSYNELEQPTKIILGSPVRGPPNYKI